MFRIYADPVVTDHLLCRWVRNFFMFLEILQQYTSANHQNWLPEDKKTKEINFHTIVQFILLWNTRSWNVRIIVIFVNVYSKKEPRNERTVIYTFRQEYGSEFWSKHLVRTKMRNTCTSWNPLLLAQVDTAATDSSDISYESSDTCSDIITAVVIGLGCDS